MFVIGAEGHNILLEWSVSKAVQSTLEYWSETAEEGKKKLSSADSHLEGGQADAGGERSVVIEYGVNIIFFSKSNTYLNLFIP